MCTCGQSLMLCVIVYTCGHWNCVSVCTSGPSFRSCELGSFEYVYVRTEFGIV